MVSLRILSGIVDGLGDDLHATHLFGFARQEERDGSDTTVEIPNGLFSGQSRIFQCQAVKLLGLYGIYLIEGERRDFEGSCIPGIRVIFFLHVPYVDRILNGALTPEIMDHGTHDHIGFLGIDTD